MTETLTCQAQTTNVGAATAKHGIKLSVDQQCYVTIVTKNSGSTATKAYLTDVGFTVLATANFISNTATFTTDTTLNPGNTYYLMVDAAGSSYQPRKADPDAGLPYNGTYFNIIGDYAGDATVTRGIQSAEVEAGAYPFPVKRKGQKELRTSWDELTASDSTKYVGHQINLVPEASIVLKRDLVGL